MAAEAAQIRHFDLATWKAIEIGLLVISHQFAAAIQPGRRIPHRGRKTAMLNGPIIQAIVHSRKRPPATRRSGVSAEIQIAIALSNRVAVAKAG